jgi:dynein light chain LC8-type
MASSRGVAGAKKKKDEGPVAVPVLVRGDMPKAMRDFTYEVTLQALEAKDAEKDQAAEVKKALEGKFGGLWHCIVGREFGASVASATGHLLFFRVGPVSVLCFETLDEEGHAARAGGEATVEDEKEDDDAAGADDAREEEGEGGGDGKASED